MFTWLIAALSLTSSLSVDVPYVPQATDLCGGAAVAMVFRYWGDTHADAQQFAPLIDRRRGGIPDDVLVDAVTGLGWHAQRVDGTLALLQEHLAAHQPIVVLLADRGDRYHYVVVTGVQPDAVVIHDPSWGPSRSIRFAEFERRWRATHFWSLVILPSEVRLQSDIADIANVRLKPDTTDISADVSQEGSSVASGVSRTSCDLLLDHAVADVQARGLADADTILGRVRDECPTSAGPIGELAGVRFAERRWKEAATLAREALSLEANDAYAIDVLGSSLFMLDDPDGALRNWNRIGKPRFDGIKIDGLHRSRYESIVDAIGIPRNGMLTADAFKLAQRRLSELPDTAGTAFRLRPGTDGYATVDATILEHETVPRDSMAWARDGLGAAVDREATLSLPGFTGQGDLWSASWRWWSNRPRVAMDLAAPRVGGLPGVWRVDAAWDAETYAVGAGPAREVTRQTHAHGGLSVSDWLTPNLRYRIGTGLDVWDRTRKAASVSGELDRRLFRDRVSFSADAERWLPVDGGAEFSVIGARAAAHSSTTVQKWGYTTALGFTRVGDEAPFGLWPGAGDGHARTPLLRAHPLLEDGIIETTSRPAFGRSLVYANVDAQRWLARPALVRVGIGAFVDAARASRRIAAGSITLVDAGMGVRIKLPTSDRILRIDVAHGITDRSTALTIGWLFK